MPERTKVKIARDVKLLEKLKKARESRAKVRRMLTSYSSLCPRRALSAFARLKAQTPWRRSFPQSPLLR